MATHPAKEKPGAQAQAKGTCIMCGMVRIGTPAQPEFPVRAARKLRSLLHLPANHTIACSGHLASAREKRARFEKRIRDYRIYAVLFFIFIVAGSLVFGRTDIGMFVPALLGALAVAILPCFYYFPSFGK